MAQFKQCSACNGRKRILGMGMMERDCLHCSGAGRVKDDNEVSSSKTDNQLRDDLRTLADAYEKLQAENEQLKAEIEQLTAELEGASGEAEMPAKPTKQNAKTNPKAKKSK